MAKVQIKSERITPWGGIFSIIEQFRVNQQVQRYKIFLKKTSVGVEKLSFSLGLALICLLILLIFPSVTFYVCSLGYVLPDGLVPIFCGSLLT